MSSNSLQKTPFLCECLGGKIPFAEFKLEKGKKFWSYNTYSLLCETNERRDTFTFCWFRGCKNSADICLDKVKNVLHLTDTHPRGRRYKNKIWYTRLNATIKLETLLPK